MGAPTRSDAPVPAGASEVGETDVDNNAYDTTDDGGDNFDGPGDGSAVGEGGRRFSTGWVAVGLVVGLVLGVAVGLLVPGLMRPGDTSVEAGFARDMSTHHAQAVEMSLLAHEKATDPDVRTLGADIALTQQGQIGTMQAWLREWHLSPTGTQPRMAWMPDGGGTITDGLMPGMATDAERAQLRAATGRDFDVMYLRLMLDHHLGGIHMAEEVTDLSDDEEVRYLAGTMVAGQKKEIAGIQALLDKLGAK
ncbi:DUF305 domain-containing protein [Micromonospora sp. NPDC050397]|uniref:DUF305 domain-containing protein n=1 Tax=Micromonospora sp. NPDC050397 TaxID=3364279 RepID=UPI00384DE65E